MKALLKCCAVWTVCAVLAFSRPTIAGEVENLSDCQNKLFLCDQWGREEEQAIQKLKAEVAVLQKDKADLAKQAEKNASGDGMGTFSVILLTIGAVAAGALVGRGTK